MTTFDIFEQISSSTELSVSKEEIERTYAPMIAILFFSQSEDTIFIANEVNTCKIPLGNYENCLYFHGMVRKRKRFYKSSKKSLEYEEKISYLMETYEYSRKKAIEAFGVIGEERLSKMRSISNKGGIIKK